MKMVATIIIDVADSCHDRKPDLEMMRRYLANEIFIGVVDKPCFRGRVVMEIKKVNVAIMNLGFEN